MGHKYQSCQIVEMLHPVVTFKAEILIRVIYSVGINRSKITIEKYYKTIEKIISTITPIISNLVKIYASIFLIPQSSLL